MLQPTEKNQQAAEPYSTPSQKSPAREHQEKLDTGVSGLSAQTRQEFVIERATRACYNLSSWQDWKY